MSVGSVPAYSTTIGSFVALAPMVSHSQYPCPALNATQPGVSACTCRVSHCRALCSTFKTTRQFLLAFKPPATSCWLVDTRTHTPGSTHQGPCMCDPCTSSQKVVRRIAYCAMIMAADREREQQYSCARADGMSGCTSTRLKKRTVVVEPPQPLVSPRIASVLRAKGSQRPHEIFDPIVRACRAGVGDAEREDDGGRREKKNKGDNYLQ